MSAKWASIPPAGRASVQGRRGQQPLLHCCWLEVESVAPFVPFSNQVEGTDRMDGVRFLLLPGHGQQQEARRKGGKDSDCQRLLAAACPPPEWVSWWVCVWRAPAVCLRPLVSGARTALPGFRP